MSREDREARLDETVLNAFVDGELPGRRHRYMAAEVARDPELAARVAALRTLKRRLAVLPYTAGPAQAPRRLGSMPPLAAIVVLLVLTAGVMLQAPWPEDSMVPGAVAAHRAWAQGDARSQVSPAAASVARQLDALIPDLEAARLSLAMTRRLHLTGDEDGVHLGYIGSRDCRVSLMLLAGRGDLSRDPVREDYRGTSIAAWSAGETDYYLLATGMAAGRLDGLVQALVESSRRGLQPDSETRLALARDRAESTPCVG